MKKVLFIDRDGTLIVEPQDNFKIDSYTKLRFIPGVITALSKIAHETDYVLVMVTNQDGLGTAEFPEESFWPAHQLMLNTLLGEGVQFAEQHIDGTYERDGKDTRKPGIGMIRHFLNGQYDMANSYVIGDRVTDVQMAKNLGCKGILLVDQSHISDLATMQQKVLDAGLHDSCAMVTSSWHSIYHLLKQPPRVAHITRKTHETDISLVLNLDGGPTHVSTGLHFLDHMLVQLGRHGGIGLQLTAQGDLHVDEHHTIEDVALVLGQALDQALGNKAGIERYGYALPMDDCLAQVALDFGGRPWLVWQAEFTRERVGDVPTEMFMHFFKSLSDTARCNLHIQATGTNEHHKIEAIFKAFAKALKMAIRRDPVNSELPSTKGIL